MPINVFMGHDLFRDGNRFFCLSEGDRHNIPDSCLECLLAYGVSSRSNIREASVGKSQEISNFKKKSSLKCGSTE